MNRACCADRSACDEGHHPSTIALAGNPNVGKSTVYNALTGENQHVANWAGKTVSKAHGAVADTATALAVVDLPGTYSLAGMSPEELEARRYLLEESPRAVIAVVDASNLERNLYLAVQLIEMGLPTVVALNMVDLADRRGVKIDASWLATELGVPVIPMVASRGEGLTALRATIDSPPAAAPAPVDYGPEVAAAVAEVAAPLAGIGYSAEMARWAALTLLEGDRELQTQLCDSAAGAAAVDRAAAAGPRLAAVLGCDPGLHIIQRRYEEINRLAATATTGESHPHRWSDRIDRIVTHRILGIPLFFASMGLVFGLTTRLPEPSLTWIDDVITGPITRRLQSLLGVLGLDGGWFEGLLIDGALTGVGAVLAFIPVLVFLYIALAILEDSGYMARAAYVVDRGMQVIGLPGKSFIPLLLGFGCNVPAIYATRTLEARRDRVVTGLLVPLMSCSARLPVYILLATAFFPNRAGLVVFSMYLLGILVAAGFGAVLTRTTHRDSPRAPLLMELPPYRMPPLRSVWAHTKRRTGMFLHDAGTIILVTSIVVWVLLATPVRGGSFADVEPGDSAFGTVSDGIAPAFAPLGFDSWEQTGAAISGFVAKEVIVSTLAQIYGVSDEDPAEPAGAAPGLVEDIAEIGGGLLSVVAATAREVPASVGIELGPEAEEPTPTRLTAAVRGNFETASGGYGAAAALAFMVFVLLYTPCVATAAAQRRELGTRWMWLGLGFQLAIAWLLAALTFQLARLLGLG